MASACIEKSHAFKNPSGFFLFWTAILLRSVQYWDKTFNLSLNKLEYFGNQSIFSENEKQTVLFSAWCQTAIQFVRYNLDITVYSKGLNQFQQSYRIKLNKILLFFRMYLPADSFLMDWWLGTSQKGNIKGMIELNLVRHISRSSLW